MTTTGYLGHIDDEEHDRRGGVLRLYGLSADDQASLRAWIGPRLSHPECGAFVVHADGDAVAKLYATSMTEGRLNLGVLDDQGQEKATAQLEGGYGGGRKARLRLGILDDEGHVQDTVRLYAGSGSHPGLVLGRDGGSSIELGWDGGGEPFVEVASGQHFTRLNLFGIYSSTKENNFVAVHPRDPSLAIHYCVLEGPEVGTYLRGSARLAGGRAVVTLPEHFADVTADEGLTVQLTPSSRTSKGVCATTLTVNRLVIEELLDGQGEYDVHYHVHGVRKGHESFRVIRPQRDLRREPRGTEPTRDDS
ncbi:MAG: hypothetical protein HY996_00590 [Micrococcales bacterium]|nr:hypothetical protein [Micrococcales bacterium]